MKIITSAFLLFFVLGSAQTVSARISIPESVLDMTVFESLLVGDCYKGDQVEFDRYWYHQERLYPDAALEGLLGCMTAALSRNDNTGLDMFSMAQGHIENNASYISQLWNYPIEAGTVVKYLASFEGDDALRSNAFQQLTFFINSPVDFAAKAETNQLLEAMKSALSAGDYTGLDSFNVILSALERNMWIHGGNLWLPENQNLLGDIVGELASFEGEDALRSYALQQLTLFIGSSPVDFAAKAKTNQLLEAMKSALSAGDYTGLDSFNVILSALTENRLIHEGYLWFPENQNLLGDIVSELASFEGEDALRSYALQQLAFFISSPVDFVVKANTDQLLQAMKLSLSAGDYIGLDSFSAIWNAIAENSAIHESNLLSPENKLTMGEIGVAFMSKFEDGTEQDYANSILSTVISVTTNVVFNDERRATAITIADARGNVDGANMLR